MKTEKVFKLEILIESEPTQFKRIQENISFSLYSQYDKELLNLANVLKEAKHNKFKMITISIYERLNDNYNNNLLKSFRICDSYGSLTASPLIGSSYREFIPVKKDVFKIAVTQHVEYINNLYFKFQLDKNKEVKELINA